MSPASHELALTIINTGEGYEERCQLARQDSPILLWLPIVAQAAVAYDREFRSKQPIFTPGDVRECAQELAEYYKEHVAELDAAAAEAYRKAKGKRDVP